MATIFIEQLAIKATIGVLPFEKQIKQTLLIDLEFDIDTTAAQQSDNLEETIDYSAIAEVIQTRVASTSFGLIERLAHAIIETITDTFDIPWLRLRLTKPYAVNQAKAVGIIMEHGSRQ